MRLSTQIFRSLFALPLLALAVAAAGGPVAGHEPVDAPGPMLAIVSDLDCAEALRPAGTQGLARMPGDIGPLGRRLRCAN